MLHHKQQRKREKNSLPTPPEPPATRISLEEVEGEVLESWVGSELWDWMSSSLTALSGCGGDPLLELEMDLEE